MDVFSLCFKFCMTFRESRCAGDAASLRVIICIYLPVAVGRGCGGLVAVTVGRPWLRWAGVWQVSPRWMSFIFCVKLCMNIRESRCTGHKFVSFCAWFVCAGSARLVCARGSSRGSASPRALGYVF